MIVNGYKIGPKADLSRAYLTGANLWDAIGNGKEVMHDHSFEDYKLAWTRDSKKETTLQIGCVNTLFSKWVESDSTWIESLDVGKSTKWWSIYRDKVLKLVEDNPAVMHSG